MMLNTYTSIPRLVSQLRGTNVGKNITTILRLMCLAALVAPFLNAYASSWGAVKDSDNQRGTFLWGWPVEDSTAPACTSSQGGLVAVGPWDPRGAHPYGGINNPGMLQHIAIPNGTTMMEAHRQWTEMYGTGGSYQKIMWGPGKDLSKTCFGFQTFVGTGTDLRTGSLLPGTSCGLVPPPNLVCTASLPSMVNLGTYSVGDAGVSVFSQGNVTCNFGASVYVSLVSQANLDGNPVNIEINGKPMGSSPAIVGNGNNVPISIKHTVVGDFKNGGVFQSSYTLVITYA